jgi:acetyl-CoA carboxylase carboxyltransferase component
MGFCTIAETMRLDMLLGHAVDLPGDGIVRGGGMIYGSPVYVFSQDGSPAADPAGISFY